MKQLSPVALFVFNRLENTVKTINHLKQNALAAHTELYVFSDGGKDEESWHKVRQVRQFLRTVSGFRSVTIIEREVNFYLERNIIEGLAQVLATHDRVIVLEDDICTSPVFLTYMNDALEMYRHEAKVMHISGFTNLDIEPASGTHLTAHMCGWAWGTWADRWQHFTHFTSRQEALERVNSELRTQIEYGGAFPCLKTLDKSPIPWDICWEIAVRKRGGLCLNPNHTLVKNIGLTNGTHYGASRLFGWYEFDRPFSSQPVVLENIPLRKNPDVELMYARALRNHGMRYNLIGRVVRFVYKKFRRRK